jgi:hypothetical protein
LLSLSLSLSHGRQHRKRVKEAARHLFRQSPGTQKTRRRTFEMKAGIRPINYAWQKGDAHNKTEFVIIPSKALPEASCCYLFPPCDENRFAGGEMLRRRLAA